MNKYTFVSILAIVGGFIGLVIGRSLEIGTISYIITPIICAVLAGLFAGLGVFLNNKGLLVNLFQLIDLFIGLLLYYVLFYFVFSLVGNYVDLNENTIYYVITWIIPFPLSVLMVVRHMKKKAIKLNKKIENEDGTISDI